MGDQRSRHVWAEWYVRVNVQLRMTVSVRREGSWIGVRCRLRSECQVGRMVCPERLYWEASRPPLILATPPSPPFLLRVITPPSQRHHSSFSMPLPLVLSVTIPLYQCLNSRSPSLLLTGTTPLSQCLHPSFSVPPMVTSRATAYPPSAATPCSTPHSSVADALRL